MFSSLWCDNDCSVALAGLAACSLCLARVCTGIWGQRDADLDRARLQCLFIGENT